jgi:PmbA protein
MDYPKLAESVVKKALQWGADEAESFLSNSRRFEINVRNGDVETVKQSSTKGIGLTVYRDKKLGFSYTSDFSPESLDEFVKKTINLSVVADQKPWNGLPDFGKEKQKDLDLWDASIAEIQNEKKIEIATKVEKIALSYDKRIKNSEGGGFRDSESEVIIMNSKGISRRKKTTSVGYGVAVIAGEGNNMQMGYWSSNKRHFKDLESIEDVAQKAGKRAVEKLGARSVETQKVPVVFDRDVAPRFWRGILSALDGDSVYKKTTFLTDSLNKSFTSELISLEDNPIIPRHVGSTPFDGEGKTTRQNTLIDKGVLKMFIYDSVTARKAGIKANTMAQRRGYKSMPTASHLNIIVQNGQTAREKILEGIEEGFYVTGLRGSGTSVSTGNFSVGASGFWIHKGEISFPVDGVTLGGDVREILKNIELVANDLDIRGNLNSPSFKLTELTVGGKR